MYGKVLFGTVHVVFPENNNVVLDVIMHLCNFWL